MEDLNEHVQDLRLSSSGPRVKPPLIEDRRPKNVLGSIQELYSNEIRWALEEEIALREASRKESNRQRKQRMVAMLKDPDFVLGLDQLPDVSFFAILINFYNSTTTSMCRSRCRSLEILIVVRSTWRRSERPSGETGSCSRTNGRETARGTSASATDLRQLDRLADLLPLSPETSRTTPAPVASDLTTNSRCHPRW